MATGQSDASVTPCAIGMTYKTVIIPKIVNPHSTILEGSWELSELPVSERIYTGVRTGIRRELTITKRRLSNTTNFRLWLEADIQPLAARGLLPARKQT